MLWHVVGGGGLWQWAMGQGELAVDKDYIGIKRMLLLLLLDGMQCFFVIVAAWCWWMLRYNEMRLSQNG